MIFTEQTVVWNARAEQPLHALFLPDTFGMLRANGLVRVARYLPGVLVLRALDQTG